MALSECSIITDLHDQELAKHGDTAFPIACYADDLVKEDVPWHWHEEWEFAVVTEGCPRFYMENTDFTLPKGDGIFINTRALHAMADRTSSNAALHSAVFHPRLIGGNADSIFWQKLVQPLFNNNATRYLILRQAVPWQRDVLEHFNDAWLAIAENQEDYEITARYHFSKAMGIILKNTDFTQSNLPEQELIRIQRIRSMMEYVDLHYTEELTVDQIAESVSISSSACLRCFHEMLKTTPIQYVIDTRLRKAATLLLETRKSAKEIAMDCGFNDISYFTRIFRTKYGCTPGKYRKQPPPAFHKHEF